MNDKAKKSPACPIHSHEMEKDGSRFVCPEPGCEMVCSKGATSTPADKRTRAARSSLYMMVSPLWTSGAIQRDEVYDRLADYLGINSHDCHIGMFDFATCERAKGFVTDLFCGDGFEDVKREDRKMSLLDQVKPTRRQRPPRIVLTGTEKIGKSTFASDFANPIFIPIDKEEGIDGVDAAGFPVAKTFADVMAAVDTLAKEKHDYKTLAIDSISTLSPLVMAEAMKREGVVEEQKLGGGYGREHNTPIKCWAELLSGLDELRAIGMTTILIGHVATTKFEDPINGSYTQFEIDLPKKINAVIKRWADSILFANWEVYRNTEDLGFNKEQHRGVGKGERTLFTQSRPSHPGGGRGIYGQLPYEMPFTYEAFRGAVATKLAEQKKATETEAEAA